jgi:hypothetical protein
VRKQEPPICHSQIIIKSTYLIQDIGDKSIDCTNPSRRDQSIQPTKRYHRHQKAMKIVLSSFSIYLVGGITQCGTIAIMAMSDGIVLLLHCCCQHHCCHPRLAELLQDEDKNNYNILPASPRNKERMFLLLHSPHWCHLLLHHFVLLCSVIHCHHCQCWSTLSLLQSSSYWFSKTMVAMTTIFHCHLG